jgi:hypothetical protein
MIRYMFLVYREFSHAHVGYCGISDINVKVTCPISFVTYVIFITRFCITRVLRRMQLGVVAEFALCSTVDTLRMITYVYAA